MFMQYNEDEAKKAGGGEYVSEGGAHLCMIDEARYVKASTGSNGIEFSVTTKDGLKANYLTVYYAKQDDTPIKSGRSILNAMMGIIGIKGLTFKEEIKGTEKIHIVPELTNKGCGLFLQKVLYTKRDNSEGYKFDIRVPFHPQLGKTLKEMVENKESRTIEVMANSYKDQDDRKAVGTQSSSAPSSSAEDDYFNQ